MITAIEAEERLKACGYEILWEFDQKGFAARLICKNENKILAALDIKNGSVDSLQIEWLCSAGMRRKIRKRKQ